MAPRRGEDMWALDGAALTPDHYPALRAPAAGSRERGFHRRLPRKEAYHTVAAIAKACDGGSQARQTSLQIMLGMLYSHGADAARMSTTVQEGLLRRAVAQLFGKADLPMVLLWCMYDCFCAWRTQMRLQSHLFEVFLKICAIRDRDLFDGVFVAWVGLLRKSYRAKKALIVLTNSQNPAVVNLAFYAWQRVVAHVRHVLNVCQKRFLAMGFYNAEIYLHNAMSAWRTVWRETREKAEGNFLAFQRRSVMLTVMAWDNDVMMRAIVFEAWLRTHREEQHELKELQYYLYLRQAKLYGLKVLLGSVNIQAMLTGFNVWIQALSTMRVHRVERGEFLMTFLHGEEEMQLKAMLSGWSAWVTHWRPSNTPVHRMAVYFISDAHAALEACVAAWHEESSSAKAKIAVLTAMLSGNNEALLATSFHGWNMALESEKWESEMETQRRAQQEKVLNSIAALVAGQIEAMAHVVMQSWHKCCVQERLSAQRRRSFSKGMATLLHLDQGKLRVLAIREWRSAVDKEIEARRQDKNRQVGLKWLMTVFDQMNNVLLSTAVQGWENFVKDFHDKLVRAKHLEVLLHKKHCFRDWLDHVQLRHRQWAMAHQTLAALGFFSKKQVQVEHFRAWAKYAMDERYNKGRMKWMAAFAHSEGRLALVVHFAAWVKVIDYVKGLQEIQNRKQTMLHTATAFLHGDHLRTMELHIVCWHNEVVRRKEEAKQERRQAVCSALIGDGDDGVLLSRCFKRWEKESTNAAFEREFNRIVRKQNDLDAQLDQVSCRLLWESFVSLIRRVFSEYARVVKALHRDRLQDHAVMLRQQRADMADLSLRMKFRVKRTDLLRRYMASWRRAAHYPRSQAERRIGAALGLMGWSARRSQLRSFFPLWAQAVSAASRCRWSARLGLVRWIAACSAVALSHAFHVWRQRVLSAARRQRHEASIVAAVRETEQSTELARAQDRASRAERAADRAFRAAVAALEKARRRRVLSHVFAAWRYESAPPAEQPRATSSLGAAAFHIR